MCVKIELKLQNRVIKSTWGEMCQFDNAQTEVGAFSTSEL